MKVTVFVLSLSSTVFAQVPPVSPSTGLKNLAPIPSVQPASPQAAVAPDAVVCQIDGKKYTAAEVSKLLQYFPPQMQLAIKSDPRKALSYILTMRYLAGEAEKAKLDQQSPNKEALEYQRLNTLAQAQINQVRNFQFNPTPDQQEQYYKANPDHYQEAKMKVIYVAFSANPVASSDPKTKKSLTEAEAKAKIEDLRKKVSSGGDFSQIAKENSDDKESAPKGGDFPPLKRNSPYPEDIKKAVFALKPGRVSEPLRQPNGFYLIRLEELKSQPYEEVRTQIYEEMKQKDFNEWMQALQKRYEVKIENPAYFTATPPPVPIPSAR
ncbi:MAG: peptidylprolyl isomerase [Bryobacteraceae bacterium]